MSPELILALAAAIVAASLAWLQLRASLYVRRREFEDIYVQRYWEISDRLGLDLRMGSYRGGDLSELADTPGNTNHRTAIWDYLALCEDQIDLRLAGNITDEAWLIWGSSINDTVNRYPYRAFFDVIESEFDKALVPLDDRPLGHLRAHLGAAGESRLLDPIGMNRYVRFATGRRERFRLYPAEKRQRVQPLR